MNLRSAFFHLLSDALFSVGVLVGGLSMYYFRIFWIDSILSIGIGLYLIYIAWRLLAKSTFIIMQFSPEKTNLQQITAAIEKIKNISNVHHVHLWQLNEHEVHFQAHIDLAYDMPVSEACRIVTEVKVLLKDQFKIDHVTLETDFGVEDDKSIIVQDKI